MEATADRSQGQQRARREGLQNVDENLLGVSPEVTARILTQPTRRTSLGNESIVAEGLAMMNTVEVPKTRTRRPKQKSGVNAPRLGGAA